MPRELQGCLLYHMRGLRRITEDDVDGQLYGRNGTSVNTDLERLRRRTQLLEDQLYVAPPPSRASTPVVNSCRHHLSLIVSCYHL